jgi:dTDP-glucose 4,6-dehydratase
MTSPADAVLITGGAGFIGSTLVRQWLADEASTLVNLDKLTYAGLRESLADVADDPRHQLVEGDVSDAQLVRELLGAHRPTAVIHLAAETHVDRSITAPPQFVRTNALGTCTLLDEAARYWLLLEGDAPRRFRLILVSTDEVFGSAAPGELFTLDSPLAPNSPYAASKAAGDHLAHAFAHTYGLPVIVINPTNNFGPRQLPEKLIPRMIVAAARGEPLPIYGDGLHERDWMHVDDCGRAIRAVARSGAAGKRYLIGGGNVMSNLQVVERICDLVDELAPSGAGRRRLITRVADRPGHDRRYAVDATPIERELGWRPQINFEQGLRETVLWYLNNPRWVAAAEESLRGRKESEKS